MISRRQFVGAAIVAGAVPLLRRAATAVPTPAPGDGRLTARVRKPTSAIEPGEHTLPLDRSRRTLLYVPSSYSENTPAPLLLCLHGATGAGIAQLNRWRKYADAAGAVVLAPSSEGMTWDAIRGTFAGDAAHIDAALSWVFERCAVDEKRVAIGGMSDGGTYSLSLGLINGDLFTHIAAFSPGFIVPGVPHAKPKVFIAHGTKDEILPFEQCGKRIAAELDRDGYSVSFHPFDGPHTMLESMLPVAGSFMGWKG